MIGRQLVGLPRLSFQPKLLLLNEHDELFLI